MPRTPRLLVVGLGLAAAFALLGSRPAHAGDTPMSVHAAELARHRHLPPPARIQPSHDRLLAARDKTVTSVVYGYYPFWVADLTQIRWEALTHLAWFSVEMNASGGIDALHGWPDRETVAAAHAANVRVDLAFTLFSGSGIKALVNDPAARQTAIQNMIDLMVEGGADGIAVDFEGFVDGTKDGFVTFVSELDAALAARGLDEAEISLAGPAVDWGGEWDVAALLDSADWFFIMGYDYFWSGSAYAGPSGILRVTDDWTHATSWAALRTIATYADRVGPEKRRKILYGVPYYGREWTTTSSAMGAPTIASVGSVTYAAARADLAAGMERKWDDGSKTPWYVFQSGATWHQVYYDDEESLAYKYRLARDQDLGGVGIWALNYDEGYDELWDLLETSFGMPVEPPLGHRYNPIAIETFPFHDGRDTTVGPSQYFNFYACAPELPEYGKEWVYRIDVCQPGQLTAVMPETTGADPDIHLLGDVLESACIARDHLAIDAPLDPGRYYLVVDTYVENGVELEGPYTLDVDFAPAPGSEPCAPHLVCNRGACVCPGAGDTECDGACVDTSSDPSHCGSCGVACPEGAACADGRCVGADGTGGGGAGPGPLAAEAEGGEGCSCRVGHRGESPSRAPWTVAALVAVGLARARRGRYPHRSL